MQGGIPESIQGVLFDARFDVIQITVPAGESKVGTFMKTPPDKSCIVLANAWVMLQLMVTKKSSSSIA